MAVALAVATMPLPQVPVSDDVLYEVCNKAVLPAWALLALFPRWKITNWIVMATALSMSAIYAALLVHLVQHSDSPPSFKDFETLAGLTEAFKAAGVLLPAWVHYLAQDLWVAKWVASDACNKRIPRLLMMPVLALTLLVGPVGPLVYFLVLRPLLGKAATTPKGKGAAKQVAAPAAVKADASSKQYTALPAPKNSTAKGQQAPKQTPAAAPAASKKAQPAKQAALPAADAAVNPKQEAPGSGAPKKNSKAAKKDVAGFQAVKHGAPAPGGKNGKAAEAPKKAAPKPAPARQEDLEDDRAFAEAAAVLLRRRAQPKK